MVIIRNKKRMTFLHKPNQKLIEASKIISEKKSYLSVTGLTGKESAEGLLEWRKRVGDEVADRMMREGAERGTTIHKFCEMYLQNEPILIPENKISEYYTFKAMKPELNNLNNIWGLEIPMWSDEYRLKGRCDCIAEYKSDLAMIDFKTSKKPKKREWLGGYFVQATAYVQMVKEQTGIDIKNIILMFGITNYNQCTIIQDKPENHIKELNRMNNEFNK